MIKVIPTMSASKTAITASHRVRLQFRSPLLSVWCPWNVDMNYLHELRAGAGICASLPMARCAFVRPTA